MKRYALIFAALLLCCIVAPLIAREHGTVVCESSDGHREFCRAYTADGVHVLRQISRTNCVEGRNWGYNDRGVWVSDGCRAEFFLGSREEHRERERDRWETVVCESDFGHTHRCDIPSHREVKLRRQLSRADCSYGRTWGYSNHELWVRDGCRAEFSIERY